MDARSPYKIVGFVLLTLVFYSCQETEEVPFRSTGFGLDDSRVFVSDLTVDSVLFSSGAYLWYVQGFIEDFQGPKSFQLIYESNPLLENADLIKSSPPLEFNGEVECVCTNENGMFRITWRSNSKSLYLESTISAH